MKYYIQRGANEYGPYTLGDLQRYVALGNILMGDLTRSEGMTDWVPVSQVIGNIPIPVPAGQPAGVAAYGAPGSYAAGAAPAVAAGPVPPDFHWALVLLIGLVTCWLFGYAWLLVEAAFVRKIKPESKGLLWMSLSVGAVFLSSFVNVFGSAASRAEPNPLATLVAGLIALASIVLYVIAAFTMRSDIEDYYNTTENIGLRLNGVGSALLTLFFAIYYFQWHFSRIAKWKKTGVLEPQN
jgi:hypothetical protein